MNKKKELIELLTSLVDSGNIVIQNESLNVVINKIDNIYNQSRIINNNVVDFDCSKCKHSFINPFDQEYCFNKYDIENDINCNGELYEKR